jgi:iron complex outermembrane recepter protein
MKLKLRILPAAVAGALTASMCGAVYAQQAADKPKAEEKVDRIEVTGTRIPPPNLDSVSPVTVIDAATIKVDGQRSVENLLNNLPQVFANQGGTISNGATGTATVDLRGLRPNRTLVLVNGRRLPYGSANIAAADLNQIPAPLIKRIEVLTGGAGAVYGSDAIAGVVNFVMNDKFEGVQVDFNQSFYQHGQQGTAGVASIIQGRAATNPREFAVPGDKSADGKVFDASIIMGGNFANGKGNATAYFGYKKEDALLQSERDFSACTVGASTTGFSCGGSGTNATGRISNLRSGTRAGLAGVFTNADAAGTSRGFVNATDQYNFGPANFFQRPSERYNANIFANYEVMDNMKLYSEFSFMDYNSVAQIAPGGAFGTVATVRGDNPLLSASWRTTLGLIAPTDTQDVVVQRRNVEGGGRQSSFRNTSFRTVLGAKGDIGNWNYDVFFQTAKVVYQQNENNYFSSTRLARALDVVNVGGVATCRSVVDGTDPACVPYNVWRLGGVTAAQLNYLSLPGLRQGSTQQTIQGGTISSDLGVYGLKLPTAKNGVGVAFGVERRTEKLNLTTDGATQAGDLSGSGGPTPGLDGKFTVQDIYAEVRVPLIEGAQFAELLSVNGSYRNSDYSNNIKTNTYGLGIEWAPNKLGKLRGTFQEAVRGANVIELFTARGLALYDNDADPCAGATPTASLAACQRTGVTAAQYGTIQDSPAGQYNFLQGGNPNLQPEKSKSYTFGLVFTPTNDISATIDYFDIKVDNIIDIVNPVTTLNNCVRTGDPTFCSQIQRDRLGTLWLLPEARIIGTNVNIGGRRTSGIDLGFNYSFKLPNYGGMNLNVVATYLQKFETEEIKGLGSYDCVGLYGNRCLTPNPEWRHKTRLTWNTPWNADIALTWRYFGEVKQDTTSSNVLLAGTTFDVNRTLAAQNYFDLAGSWAVTKKVVLRAGVNNLLDKDPPITAISGSGIFGNGNTFPQVYDALGRKFFFNVTAKF